MKTSVKPSRERGLTLVELFVVLAVLAFLAAMIIPAQSSDKARAYRIGCVNNLKQIGLAELEWSRDNDGKFPFNGSQTDGGVIEFTSGPNEFKYFQVISNELGTPRILICSAESDRLRKWTTNFSTLGNSNLSYFVGLDSTENNPDTIVSGDRNITNGMAIKNGILELTTNRPSGWTAEMHNKVGNLVQADGSVQQVRVSGLRAEVADANTFTNRLLMPILGP